MSPRTLLLTLGDPNGLGPELVCRWLLGATSFRERLVLIGPESTLLGHARRLGLDPPWTKLAVPHANEAMSAGERSQAGGGGSPDVPAGANPGFTRKTDATGVQSTRQRFAALATLQPGLYLLEPGGLEDFVPRPGQFAVQGGLAAGLSLSLACDLLEAGLAQGIVTCPLNKAGLQEAGFDFPGHTEFLAERAGVGRDGVCMHLSGPRLRVSLVTTHPPLKLVPELVTYDKVLRCLRQTAAFVDVLGLKGPVAVCGLNPHAGESGKIGDEESRVIRPAIEQAQSEGLDVEGPYPADTVFYRAWRGEFPAVLAMYHDQGLGPLKLVHFGQSVNVTLGLPYVRTSVDHGTGYELVGDDSAEMGSFQAAVELARRLTGVKQ